MLGDYKMLVVLSFEYANTASFQASLFCLGQEPYDCWFHSRKFYLSVLKAFLLENKMAIFNGKNWQKSANFLS